MLMLPRNSRIQLDLCLELVYGFVDADIQSYGQMMIKSEFVSI